MTAPRILHVTEAMSTGVLTFIDSISRGQVGEGAAVEVLYTVRSETPARAALEARFDDRVVLLPPIDRGSGRANLVALARETRRRARGFDVVHFHSSIAGAVGRIALLGTGARVAYSPHGFAFLRENTAAPVRALARLVERLLARRSVLVLTSRTEIELARTLLHTDAAYLQSGVPAASVPPARTPRTRRPQVTMLGRIAYQKAPWRFAAVARALHDAADFVWVGGGDDADRERWIGDAPVDVHAWVEPDELERILVDTDVLLFPTLWEGMSLSLIQAQGRGIPAVTSDIVGNRDTVEDGVTGFVRSDDVGFIEATRRLVEDPDLRARMGDAARHRILDHFTDDRIGADSIAIYRDRALLAPG